MLIILLLSSSGCGRAFIGRTEIDEIIFIRVMGFDKGTIEGTNQVRWDDDSDTSKGYTEEDDDIVTVTVSAKKDKRDGGNSSGGQQVSLANNITSSGRTVFDALRNLTTFANKKPFYGHTDFLIFSEDAIKDNVFKYTDFIERDYEARLNSKVYMVKGNTVHNLITSISSGDIYISDYLKSLERNISGTSISKSTSLLEFMNMLDKEYGAPYLPCIELIEDAGKEINRPQAKKQGSTGGGETQQFLKLTGYGILKKEKLIGHISGREARGFNWIKGFISSGVIVVKGRNEDKISLEIIGTNTSIKPSLKGGTPSVNIKVSVDSNIGEYHGKEDIFTNEYLDFLGKQQEQIVKSEITSAAKVAQKHSADFLGIGDAFHHMYPAQWEDTYEKNWREIFPEIEINVEVASNINRTYIIREPAGTKRK